MYRNSKYHEIIKGYWRSMRPEVLVQTDEINENLRPNLVESARDQSYTMSSPREMLRIATAGRGTEYKAKTTLSLKVLKTF